MTKKKRVGIICLKMHSKKFLELSPEEVAENIKRFGEFHKRWKEKIEGLRFYHAIGLEEFDSLTIWEVKDVGDWISYNEEYMREFGEDWENRKTYIGITDGYWEEVMKDSSFFKRLAEAVYGSKE